MAENANTSKKRKKNIEKAGGWDPSFVQFGQFRKPDLSTEETRSVRHRKGAADAGNRPAEATRKTRKKNWRKHRNG